MENLEKELQPYEEEGVLRMLVEGTDKVGAIPLQVTPMGLVYNAFHIGNKFENFLEEQYSKKDKIANNGTKFIGNSAGKLVGAGVTLSAWVVANEAIEMLPEKARFGVYGGVALINMTTMCGFMYPIISSTIRDSKLYRSSIQDG